MARTVTIEQAYALTNNLYEQATGQKAVTVADLTTFTSVAQSILALKPNQVMKGLSEVLSGIDIGERPWKARFRLNWRNMSAYGAYRLKISYLDDNAKAEKNPATDIKDGDKIGVHNVKLPKAYEANIWGRNTMMAYITITEKQVRTAFQTPGQVAQFFGGLMTNIENQLEQQREGMCRANILSLVGGIHSYKASLEDPDMKKSTIHLFTEYKDRYKKEYATLADLRAVPLDYQKFIEYAFARMEDIVDYLGNRDKFYHVNPTEDPKASGLIMRHSSPENLRCYICKPYITEIRTQVMTDIWHNGLLQYVPHENILFWQQPETPDKAKVNTQVFKKDGTVEDTGEQTIDNLFAVLFDKDAAGVGMVEKTVGDTPYDVERDAMNRYWKSDVASNVDFTEKAVIFLFD